MNTITAIIPGPLPSLNALLRMHWAKRKRFKDGYILALPKRRAKAKKKMLVSIAVFLPTRRFDIDNLHGAVKLIIDALRRNNLIYQDSPRWIDLNVSQSLDRFNPRTEIFISGAVEEE